MKIKIYVLVLLFLVLAKPVLVHDSTVLSIGYQNGFLSADIQSATIKDIFEELKKQAGFNYEIEKEIQEQKVSISFKEKELTQAIKDILNTIGNPSYMISYKNVGAIGQSPKYDVSGITIRKRGSMSPEALAKGEKRELQAGEMEVGLVDGQYYLKAKDMDMNELLAKLSNISGAKIVADRIDKKIDFEEGSINYGNISILIDHIFLKIRPKIYNIGPHFAEIDRKGNVIKEGYYEVTQLSETEIRQRREQAELKNAEGERLMKQGRYLEALDSFGSVPDPDDIRADINMGKIYLLNREYSNAIDHFTTALDIDSTSVDAYIGLSETYEKMGQMDKAIESMEIYILLEKDVKKVEKVKGKLSYFREEKISKYCSFIKEGDEFRSKGEMDLAEGKYKEAIEIKPDLMTAYKKIAEISKDIKKYQKAEEMYKKAIEIEKDNFELYSNLAELYVEMGENKEAVKFFNKFYEVYPNKNPIIKTRVEEAIKALKGNE